MLKLLAKLNELTNDKYSMLKLHCVNVNVKSKRIEVNFLYPPAFGDFLLANENDLTLNVNKVMKCHAHVDVKLIKSHFDKSFFMGKFMNFIEKFPLISNSIAIENIAIDMSCDAITITISLEKTLYDYACDRKLLAEFDEYLDCQYCEKIVTKLESYQLNSDEHESSLVVDADAPVIVLDDPNGRYIRPQNVEQYIGKIVYDRAMYCEDATTNREEVAFCGKISSMEELTRKPKDGVISDKKYYKFILEDFTGRVNCIYFPSKYTQQQIAALKDGKEIVARGKLEKDTFRNSEKFTFMIRDLSLCSLPENFVVNKARRQVDKNYHYIFPKPYVDAAQATLFDEVAPICSFLLGKTFCVFDLETTGVSCDKDRIIEFGAVKIVDGILTETFSCFVNPEIPIPARITEITSITDADVYDQRTIREVLPDFFKFSDGTILVAQNAGFDCGFIREAGKPMNIVFDNEVMDTMLLARKHLKGLKNYKLGTIIEAVGVSNDFAHRAIHDATATAKAFVKICEIMVQNA